MTIVHPGSSARSLMLDQSSTLARPFLSHLDFCAAKRNKPCLNMSITRTEALTLLNPLTAQDVTPFFRDSLSPNLKWTYGAPGATHALAGTYDGLGPFVAGTWARLAACFNGERSIKLQVHAGAIEFEKQMHSSIRSTGVRRRLRIFTGCPCLS